MNDHERGMGAAIREVLFSEDDIGERVAELASALCHDYRRKRPLVVGVLNGSFPFLADLVRAMDMPLEVDFMAVSSYGAHTSSSGVVRILKDLNQAIEGREVGDVGRRAVPCGGGAQRVRDGRDAGPGRWGLPARGNALVLSRG